MLETNLLYDNGEKIYTISYVILNDDSLFLTEVDEKEIFNKVDEGYKEGQFEIVGQEENLETGEQIKRTATCVWKVVDEIQKYD